MRTFVVTGFVSPTQIDEVSTSSPGRRRFPWGPRTAQVTAAVPPNATFRRRAGRVHWRVQTPVR